VQCDEPLLEETLLRQLVRQALDGGWDSIVTAVYRITEATELDNSNTVKVVRGQAGDALYFSRSAIPHGGLGSREQWLERCTYWGHVGVYAYGAGILRRLYAMRPTPLEQVERLEQLRLLEMGFRISTFETSSQVFSVNTPGDLERLRQLARDGAVL
jgi:3-deoxy-manno-octulosonate cytidylyltransferase (CMP-KDO synthetase)